MVINGWNVQDSIISKYPSLYKFVSTERPYKESIQWVKDFLRKYKVQFLCSEKWACDSKGRERELVSVCVYRK